MLTTFDWLQRLFIPSVLSDSKFKKNLFHTKDDCKNTSQIPLRRQNGKLPFEQITVSALHFRLYSLHSGEKWQPAINNTNVSHVPTMPSSSGA